MLVLGSHYLHIQFTHFLYTVCMHIRTYVRTYVCVYVCVFVSYMIYFCSICIHTCICDHNSYIGNRRLLNSDSCC